MEEPTETTPDNQEPDVTQAISAFEHILDVMPNDRLALESLYDAYISAGDMPHALKYLSRLADVLMEESDEKGLQPVIEKLTFLSDSYPEATAKLNQIEAFIKKEPEASGGTATLRTSATDTRADISSEIALAWNLYEEGQLTEEEYSNISKDLTELASKNMEVPVSVLHIIEDRGFKNVQSIITYLAEKSKFPFISLSNFEIQMNVCRKMPIEYMTRRGAIPFDKLGNDYMVAILNPFDASALSEVRTMLGGNCHFYIVNAPDYDNALSTIKKEYHKDSDELE